MKFTYGEPSDLPEDRVHLFQSLALCLWNEEVYEENTQEEPTSKEEIQAPVISVSPAEMILSASLTYQEIAFNIDGTIKATAKLFIQFAEAAIDVPLALVDRGKISAINVQLQGPQPYAKLTIYSQIMTTHAHPAAGFADQSLEYLEATAPVTTMVESIPADAANSSGRRPTLSMIKSAGKAGKKLDSLLQVMAYIATYL